MRTGPARSTEISVSATGISVDRPHMNTPARLTGMKIFQLRTTERSFSGLDGIGFLAYLPNFPFQKYGISCSNKLTRVDKATARGTIEISWHGANFHSYSKRHAFFFFHLGATRPGWYEQALTEQHFYLQDPRELDAQRFLDVSLEGLQAVDPTDAPAQRKACFVKRKTWHPIKDNGGRMRYSSSRTAAKGAEGVARCHDYTLGLWTIGILTYNPFTPEVKKTILHSEMYKWCSENWQYNHFSFEQVMESQVLHTVWCNISGEA